MKKRIKESINEWWLAIFTIICMIFAFWYSSQEFIIENVELRSKVYEYEEILRFEHGRTFESYKEYITYRYDSIEE